MLLLGWKRELIIIIETDIERRSSLSSQQHQELINTSLYLVITETSDVESPPSSLIISLLPLLHFHSYIYGTNMHSHSSNQNMTHHNQQSFIQ